MTNSDGRTVAIGCTAVIAALALVLFAIVPGFVALFSFTKTDGGHSAVVRNGGPFDNNSVRQVLQPSSSVTYTGLWSDVHEYPAQSRFYDIVPTGNDLPGVNAYRTPTKDGVDVGLTARINFKVSDDADILARFDDAFGTRKFPAVDGSGSVAPWEGDPGFATFLDVIVKPVIEETLRQQVGGVECEDLQASCALVKNNDPNAVAAAVNGQTNADTLQAIQKNVNDALGKNVNDRLGVPFMSAIQFSLTGVDLPAQIRARIEAAQAEFAGASAASARKQTAELDAQTNAARQAGYNACATCAEIDRIKAQGDAWALLPQGTVWAPGNGNVLVPTR